MHRLFSLLVMLVMLVLAQGCDIPYKDEYDKAMKAKREAERIAAEMKKQAVEAKGELEKERNSLMDIYTK
jgi:hypothetical protein